MCKTKEELLFLLYKEYFQIKKKGKEYEWTIHKISVIGQ
jgi:hypothetical protein